MTEKSNSNNQKSGIMTVPDDLRKSILSVLKHNEEWMQKIDDGEAEAVVIIKGVMDSGCGAVFNIEAKEIIELLKKHGYALAATLDVDCSDELYRIVALHLHLEEVYDIKLTSV